MEMTSKKSVFPYILLVIMAVFFMINRLLPVELVFLGALFVFTVAGNRYLMKIEKLERVIIMIALLTGVQVALDFFFPFSDILNQQVALKEIERAVIYVLLLQIVSYMKVDYRLYTWLWRIVMIIVVAICFIQYFKPFDVDSFLKSFYGDSVQFYNSARNDIERFRGGSVFVNPNFMACFLTAYLGNYLLLAADNRESVFLQIMTYVIVFAGVILSGSRTGAVIYMIELFSYYYFRTRDNIRDRRVRYLLILAAGAAGVVLLLVMSGRILSTYRAFQLVAGLDDSLGGKLSVLWELMRQADAANVLIGYGPFFYANDPSRLVDFESGYFIAYYGLVGIFLLIALYRAVVRYGEYADGYRFQARRNTIMVLCMLLFGLTSGIYLNLRMFSIFLVMFFPAVVRRANEGPDHEEIRSV